MSATTITPGAAPPRGPFAQLLRSCGQRHAHRADRPAERRPVESEPGGGTTIAASIPVGAG